MTRAKVEENYTNFAFDFEKQFRREETVEWMSKNWTSAIYYCVIYVLFIFWMKYYMRNKRAFQLRLPLIVWNASLALFSVIGSVRTIPALYHTLSQYGFYHSICVSGYSDWDQISLYWRWIFTLSKLAELLDTVFIVLRKRPLIFLHWYHHVSVLIISWCMYENCVPSYRWYMSMNFTVHSLMYTYYALRAVGFSTPKYVAVFITLLQIVQMIVGCVVTVCWYLYTFSERGCPVSDWNIELQFLMYSSYLVLFSRFFYQSYLSAPSGRKTRIA